MTRASVKISQGEIVFYHLESGLNFKCYRVTFGSMTGFAIVNQNLSYPWALFVSK